MTQYKLMYFNGKGLGELIRYIFAVAGKDYIDERIEFSEWPQIKGKMLFGQLPQLIITENGKETILAQSGAIVSYLARKFGLTGKDELTQARAEMILDHLSDIHSLFRDAMLEQNPELKAEKFKKVGEYIPQNFAPIEKILETQKTKYLVTDDHLTVADLGLAVALDRFGGHLGETLEKYPLIKALNQRVNNNVKLYTYKATRPTTSCF